MRSILYIGHFKTGSTSIQHYFSRNWLRLLEAGVLYPAVESVGAARAIRLSLRGEDEGVINKGLNVIEPHNALALRLKTEEDGHGVPHYYPNVPSGFQMFEMIVNQAETLKPDAIVLCSEVFALLGLTKDRTSISRIHNRLGGYDTTLYCSLRRPDDYLSSWHRQRLKFGEKLIPLRAGALLHYLDTAHFQQSKLIRGWLDGYFEGCEVILRDFDAVAKNGGSIVDFMEHTRLPTPKKAVVPGMMNPSVPSAFAEIARLALHEMPRKNADRIISWLISMRDVVPHVSDKDVEVFGPEMRNLLVDRFRPIEKDLAVMTGNYSFYSNIDDLARLRTVPELEAARAALSSLKSASRESILPLEERSWLTSLTLHDD